MTVKIRAQALHRRSESYPTSMEDLVEGVVLDTFNREGAVEDLQDRVHNLGRLVSKALDILVEKEILKIEDLKKLFDSDYPELKIVKLEVTP